MLFCVKRNCYNSKIGKCKHDSNHVYKLVAKLMGITLKNSIPDGIRGSDLAEQCADFFLKQNIRLSSIPTLDQFNDNKDLVEKSVVKQLINKVQTKSCELYYILTYFLKEHLEEFLLSLTYIINIPLEYGVFAADWKFAILRPLLKKIGLDLIH